MRYKHNIIIPVLLLLFSLVLACIMNIIYDGSCQNIDEQNMTDLMKKILNLNFNNDIHRQDMVLVFSDDFIDDFGLHLYAKRSEGNNIYELYCNDNREFMALYREGNNIKCIQYINNYEYNDLELLSDCSTLLFGHEHTFDGSGLYLHSFEYYLLDGSRIIRVKSKPYDDFECIVIKSDTGNIVTQIYLNSN